MRGKQATTIGKQNEEGGKGKKHTLSLNFLLELLCSA